MRRLALDVRGRLPADRGAAVTIAGVAGGRPLVIVAVNDSGRDAGLKAGRLVRVAAQALGGGGGGKDDVAQGGGTDPAKVADALRQVEQAVRDSVDGR
jgi:alanyl-tRNA synthetase